MLSLLASAVQQSAQGSISQRKVYEATKVKAYNEIRGAANNGNSENFTIKYNISDAFPKDLRKLYVSQVEYSSKLFATFFPNKEVMNIYLYTEKEEKKIKSDPILGRYFDDLGRWFSEWKKGQGLEHNLGLVASYVESENGWQGHAGLVVNSKATTSSLRKYAVQVMPHEYFHVVQDYYLNVGRKFNWPSSDLYDKYSPPPFREGSANTISFALASKSKIAYMDLYRNFIGEKRNQSDVKIFSELKSESDVVKALTLMENRNNRQDVHEASYAVGQLLYEWVIAKYGFEGYRKIVENQITVDSFEANIKKSLGITTQELYKKAAPHIVAAFKFGY
ncbi:MAG: hypothetical protein ACKN9O_06750 [Actinomycetota bacterium]